MRCGEQAQFHLSLVPGLRKVEVEISEGQGRESNCVCTEDNVRGELLAMCRYKVDGKYGNIVKCGFGRRFQVVPDKSHRYRLHSLEQAPN